MVLIVYMQLYQFELFASSMKGDKSRSCQGVVIPVFPCVEQHLSLECIVFMLVKYVAAVCWIESFFVGACMIVQLSN